VVVTPVIVVSLFTLFTAAGEAFMSFRPGGEESRFTIPHQDCYLLLTVPELTANRRLRSCDRRFMSESIQRFYGAGNASPEPSDLSLPRNWGDLDVAWSADARPIAAHFSAGETF
jgi:hypothetical protein